jgi:hypothetical protein
MATGEAVGSNVELVRDYTRRVFNEHNPELAAEFVTPDVKWHGGTLGSSGQTAEALKRPEPRRGRQG